MCKEKRISIANSDEIFKMDSYYYKYDVSSDLIETNLGDYEIDYGYHLCFVTLDEVVEHNKKALKNYQGIFLILHRCKK